METYLITKDGSKRMSLDGIKYTLQENNSRVSDAMFTKIMWTFTFNTSDEFIKELGDYESFESVNLLNKIECYLHIEGRTHEAILYIQNIEGKKITAEIDYGFEELPNFDKKLSEIPYENFDVTDIYDYAKSILPKTYPATNFNFPRIYTKKYDTSNEVWKNYDGYYNDLKPDGSGFRRNYVDAATQVIYNINVMHPCPHILYLLRKGFEDAGFTLDGDILSDPKLQNKWVFSGTEYFSTLAQKKYGILINSFDDYQLVMNYLRTQWLDGSVTMMPVTYGVFKNSKVVEKIGDYKLLGNYTIKHWNNATKKGYILIKLNDNVIFKKEFSSYNLAAIALSLDFTVNTPNSTLSIEAFTATSDTGYEVCKLEIIGAALEENSETVETKVITNLNKIDIRRAVPNITFGELVTIIKNWFNYDIEIVNKTVYMTRLGKVSTKNAVDFQMMEVPAKLVKRTLLNKKSFLLKVTELDGDHNKNNMYFDIEGPKLNGTAKTDTTTIEINGYLMPLYLPKPQGYNTALVAKDSDSILALVEYNGVFNAQNNASYSPGCDFPELFDSDWVNWLKPRVSGTEFVWKKNVPIMDMSNFNIKDFVFCFKNNHIIKSWQKEKVSENTYNVEFTTETVN